MWNKIGQCSQKTLVNDAFFKNVFIETLSIFFIAFLSTVLLSEELQEDQIEI